MPQQQALILEVNSIKARLGAMEASRALDQVGKSAKQATTGIEKLESAARKMQSVGKVMTVGLTLPMVAVGTAATKMASDAAEAANKFDVVMGPAAARLRDRFKELHSIIPATRAEMEMLTSGVQDLLVPLGLARNQAAEMSLAMLELGADIASFNNVSTTQVLEDFKSGLAGMSRPLRKYGIDVSNARLETIALEEGLMGAGEEMSAAVRAQALLIAATKDSTDALGDSARTAKDAANQFRFLVRNLKEMATTVGNSLLPVITPMVQQMNEMLKAADGLSSSTVQWSIAIGAVLAVGGPLLLLIGSLTTAITGLVAAGASLVAIFAVGAPLLVGLGALAALFVKNKLEAAAFRAELDNLANPSSGGGAQIGASLDEARARLEESQQRLAALRVDMEGGGGRSASVGTLQQEFNAELATMIALSAEVKKLEGQLAVTQGIGNDMADGLDRAADAAERAASALDRINPDIRLAGRASPMAEMLAKLGAQGKIGGSLPTNFGAPSSVSAQITDQSLVGQNLEGVGGIGDKIKGMLDGVLGPLKQGFSQLWSKIGPAGLAIAALFDIVKGAMEPLQPVLDALRRPLRIVGVLIGQTLAPVLELLVPIIEMLARAFTLAVQAAGFLVEAIGWLIDKLTLDLLGWGEKLQDFGQAMQDNAEAARRSIDATDEATEATKRFSAALSNVPRVLALNALRHRIATGSTPGGGGGGGGGGPGGPGGPPPVFNMNNVTIHTRAENGEQLLEELGRLASKHTRRGGTTRLSVAT